MKTTEILEKIKSLNKEKLDSGYALFEFNPSKGVYFGIDCNNRIALVIESCNEVLNTRIQTTRELKLMFNITSSLKINNLITEKKVHILICNSTKDEDVYAFLMLAQSFIQCEDYKNYSNICELFLVFVDLFSQDKAVNHKELQGFYAELYTILYVFEQTQFFLCDSIGKKIKVVNEIIQALDLKNIKAEKIRAEEIPQQFDFVVSRAVTRLKPFYHWVKNKFLKGGNNSLPNGILYLKGGILSEELQELQLKTKTFPLEDYFKEEFFETKKIIYISVR